MSRYTSDPAHVLVVDDQDSGRFVKSQILRRAGFVVHEAGTGQEALDAIGANPVDLVVLDVNLPDIGGLEVCRRIREQHPGPPSIQVLHMSATAVTTRDHAQGLNVGADAYLSEPLDASVLVATAEALLRVRRAEQSLAEALAREQRARADAERANQVKDDFIATLSHELRTPLNALMGWVFQLRQSNLSETARQRALDSVERNTRLQAQLINDLLDISRIAKGKLQLHMRPVNLAVVLQEVAEAVAGAAERKRLGVSVEAETAWVAGDEGRLQQIVANLVNNAVQFTPEGGRVALAVKATDGVVEVRVTDTGAGIDPALLPYVFEPFRQGRDGLARVHGGLGIGLAVVQQLVELHDGQVEVSSAGTGRGTTFIISLPVLPPPASGGSELPLLQGLNVSVVGDSAEGCEMIAAMLEPAGAHVRQRGTASAEGADGRPDATVRDGEGGVEIGCTADGDEPGALVRLTKPLRPAALVRAILQVARVKSSQSR